MQAQAGFFLHLLTNVITICSDLNCLTSLNSMYKISPSEVLIYFDNGIGWSYSTCKLLVVGRGVRTKKLNKREHDIILNSNV